MAALVSKRVRTAQPQPGEALLIDWNNPVTRDLAFAFSHADAAYGFCANGQTLVPYVGASQANTVLGTGARSTSTSSRAYNLSSTGMTSNTYSLFAVGSTTSNAVTQIAIDCDNNSTRKFQFRLANGKAEFIPFTGTATTGVATSPTAMSVAELSRGFTIGATLSPTRSAVFQNGVVTTATPSNPNALIGTAYIGARWAGDAGWATGALMLVAGWNRTLTDAEQQSLADNPWQLFKPAPRRLWMPRTASAAYVLQAAVGTFAWSASEAVLLAARRLVVAAGTLTSSGSSANLVVARRMTGGPGTIAVNGSFASILAARKLTANVGTFGLSGTSAPMIATRRFTVQPGAFVLSPGTVQMTYSPAQGPVGPTYVLGATGASFSLGSNVTQLKFNRRLQAASGTIVLAGSVAKLRAARRLQADSANYAVAGSAVVLTYTGSAGQIDISKIPLSRIVVFEGSGSRMVPFGGSGSRIVPFEGSGSRVVPFEGSGSRVVVFESSGSKTVRFE